MWTPRLVTLLALAGMVSAAHANLVANGSFEDPGLVTPSNVGEGVSAYFYTVGSGSLPGWSIFGATGEQVHNTTSKPVGSKASDGNFWIDLTGVTGYNKGVSSSFATLADTAYLLSFDLGALKASGFGSVTAEVLVNGVSAGLFSHTPVAAAGTWQSAGIDWKTFSVPFLAAPSTTSTTISFLGRANGSNSNPSGIGLDNVSVVSEPQAYGLALAGMGIVVFSMHRSRRQRQG
jgi:hypothetical protein